MDSTFLLRAIPRLPMRELAPTRQFYREMLGFNIAAEYGEDYLIAERDGIELHFFLSPELNPLDHDGMCYIRVKGIRALYEGFAALPNVVHPNGHLRVQPWGQTEFSVLDINGNQLTFGEENEAS